MSALVNDAAPASAVGRFADGLLADDLPGLPRERRWETIGLIERRVAVLPSITRLGVRIIGLGVQTIGTLVGHERVRRVVVALPLPLVSEYPRLVRSLGYAYVWETWPETAVDGTPR